MSSAATGEALAPGTLDTLQPQANRDQQGWIHSRWFDLAFFTLSPITGVLLVWAASLGRIGIWLNVAAVFFIAIPHYLSSFSFYLGDDTLNYYRTRRMAFFVAPVLVGLTVVLMRVSGWNDLLQAGIYTWNIFHVSRQSSGILALYRRLGGGNPAEKPVTDLAFISLNGSLAFWFISRFPQMNQYLVKIHPATPQFIGPVLLLVAIYAWGKLLWMLCSRPRRMGMPELSFLISSALLFHPYLWVKDPNVATFAMLMGHFIQYLSIVWMLHARKYAESHGSLHQRALGAISTRIPALLVTLFACGALFYITQRGTAMLGVGVIYLMLWNALAVVHFYLDGLIWAFKQPFVRQSIGSHLTLESHRVQP